MVICGGPSKVRRFRTRRVHQPLDLKMGGEAASEAHRYPPSSEGLEPKSPLSWQPATDWSTDFQSWNPLPSSISGAVGGKFKWSKAGAFEIVIAFQCREVDQLLFFSCWSEPNLIPTNSPFFFVPWPGPNFEHFGVDDHHSNGDVHGDCYGDMYIYIFIYI